MRVFVTGGTGFVGNYIVDELLRTGHQVRMLVRPGSRDNVQPRDRVAVVEGDVTDASSFHSALEGIDAVIHLVGIIEEEPARGITFERIHYEGTANMVDAAQTHDIETFVFMSANGARLEDATAYQRSKWQAEEYVRGSGINHWTIFRPSFIFGDPESGTVDFATRLAQTLIRPFPILPVFGNGRYKVQPVAVEAVAKGFVQALDREKAANRTYCVAGRERYTFVEALDIITRALGREPMPKINVPINLARPMVALLGGSPLMPITRDQFYMLIEGNTCDPSGFYADFDVPDVAFSSDHLDYIPA